MMDFNQLIGTIALFCALGIILITVLWSRKTIEYISRKKLNTAREIIKNINDEKN